MELVKNYEEIKRNIATIDNYLKQNIDPEYTYALDLIKKRTCFLSIVSEDEYKFYPSRFIGYKDNTMKKHLNNEYKDGKETTPQISTIIGVKLEKNDLINIEYAKYCEKLGFIAREKGSFGVERKFWLVS